MQQQQQQAEMGSAHPFNGMSTGPADSSRLPTGQPEGGSQVKSFNTGTPCRTKLECVLLEVTGIQGVGRFVRICRVAKRWAVDGKVQVLCLHDHNLRSDEEDEHARIAQQFGFTVAMGRAADGAHRGGSMVMLSERGIQLKTFEEGSITRVSLEWQGREYDIASIIHGMTILKDSFSSVI